MVLHKTEYPMGTAVNYNFEACECLDVNGVMIGIPPGIWPVAEVSAVSVYINGRVLQLNNSSFQDLKIQRKAVLFNRNV